MASPSRIPQPRTSTSRTIASHRHSLSQSIDVSPMDIDTLRARLDALGAPPISKEDLSRLTKGAFGNALVFLADHVRGRSGVTASRTKLHELFADEGARRKLALTGMGSVRLDLQKANSRLEGAKREARALDEQLSEQEAALCVAEREVRRLQDVLESKRRVDLLLLVLEKKERIRERRFEAITGLLQDLRKRAQEENIEASTQSVPAEPASEAKRDITRGLARISHTKDALARLNAHHIYLDTLALRLDDHDPEELEVRIRQTIARLEGLPESDDQVEVLLQRIKNYARTEAKKRVQFHPQVSNSEDPEKALAHKTANDNTLQEVYDRTTALGFLCDNYLTSLEIYDAETSTTLLSALEEAAPLVKGYINTLQQTISTVSPRGTEKKNMMRIQEKCGIRGRVTQEYLLDTVEKRLRRVHEAELFVVASQVIKPTSGDHDSTLIEKYYRDTEQAHDQATKLLTRKSAKAELAQTISRDVETMHREAQVICDLGLA